MTAYALRIIGGDDTLFEQLGHVPGLRIDDDGIVTAPENAAWIVEAYANAAGAQIAVFPRSLADAYAETSHLARGILQELRTGVWETSFSYQRELVLNRRDGGVILLWSPGAGKTRAGIMWGLAAPGLFIYVTPTKLRGNILREFRDLTTVEPLVLKGTTPSPIPQGTRAVIVGWDILAAWWRTLSAAGPVSILYDEIHRAQSHRRWRAVPRGDSDEVNFVALNNMSHAAMRLSRRARRRLGATGTWVWDRVRNLWGQIDLIVPGEFGPYYGKRERRCGFAWRYCDAHAGEWGGVDDRGASNVEELERRLAFIVDFVPYAVSHGALPPLTFRAPHVTLDEQDTGDALVREMKRAAKEGIQHLTEVKLWAAASRKRSAVVERVVERAQAGQKIVVLTARRKDCDVISEKLRKALDATVWIGAAHGEQSIEERDRLVAEYMRQPSSAVFVGTGQAFGEGVNLQSTDYALFAMLPYTPGMLKQWLGRFRRPGMDRGKVQVEALIADGTADEHVRAILLGKIPAAMKLSGDAQFDEVREALRGLSDQEAGDSLFAKIATG